MTPQAWSFVLNWSRVGVNAALFLAATRVLTLAEIGLFATAFAPIRLIQAVQKAGLSDAVVMFGSRARRWPALFALSIITGTLAAAAFVLIGALTSPLLLALAVIPLANGIGAVPEGILRHRLALKALALRTLAAQSIAALTALALLLTGYGVWALIAFAILSATLTNALSLLLAGWRPSHSPTHRHLALIAPKTAQIAGRVALGSSQTPLAQLAIGLTLGPAAAGAFQIATRMVELIEALTLSPLRFIALPRLTQSNDQTATLRGQLHQTALLSAWVWGGTLAATPAILTLAVGGQHADAATPILRALMPMALTTALMMPVLQALTARKRTELVLARTALTLALAVALSWPALAHSTIAMGAALSAAAMASALWVLHHAARTLGLSRTDLLLIAKPLSAAALMVAALWLAPPLPLIAQIIAGTAVYAGLLFLTQRPERRYA